MRTSKCSPLLAFSLSLSLTTLSVGCTKQEPREQERKESIEAILSSAGELPRAPERAYQAKETTKDVLRSGKPVVEYKDKSSPDVIESGIYRLVQRTLSLSGYELEKDYKTNLAPEVVWPGNIIYARTVELPNLAGVPELNKYRTPGRVTMAVLNGSASLTREITDYRFSEVNKALNELVASNTKDLPANFTYSLHTVQTLGEASYYLNIPEEELLKDERYKIFRKINWHSSRYKSVLTFSQDLFTLVYDDPENGPTSLFTSQLSPDLLSRFTSVGNPLAYISSVTYGRRCIAIIEETERTYRTKAEQDEALEQSLDRVGKISREGSKTPPKGKGTAKKLRNLKIYLHLVGGKDIFSSDVSLTPTMAELQRFLLSTSEAKSKNYGVPVSCTVKYLHELKPLSVPHKASGTYSYQEYIPEEDNNQMSLYNMKLEAIMPHNFWFGDPHLECVVDNLEVRYNADNTEKTETLLKGHKEAFPVQIDPRTLDAKTWTYSLFTIPLKGLTMPSFGVVPKGYIQLSIAMHTERHSQEKVWENGREKWVDHVTKSEPSRRILYFRFNPRTAMWYLDTKEADRDDYRYRLLDKIVDEPFRCLVTKGRVPTQNGLPSDIIALRLHYTLATKLRGALPHKK